MPMLENALCQVYKNTDDKGTFIQTFNKYGKNNLQQVFSTLNVSVKKSSSSSSATTENFFTRIVNKNKLVV